MIACESLQGQGVVVTDCKGAAVVANKLKNGLHRPRGGGGKAFLHRAQIAVTSGYMPSHQTAQAEADLLAGQAEQEVQALPSELSLFRRAAAAARSFWSLFPAACSPPHKVQEDQVSLGRWPKFPKAVSLFSFPLQRTAQAPLREALFYKGTRKWMERENRFLHRWKLVNQIRLTRTLMFELMHHEEIDECVSVVEDRQESSNRVFMVGTHPCIITAGGTRMACKKCSRYVTSLSRQDCKPKARGQAKRAGKAPQKQKGERSQRFPQEPLAKCELKVLTGPNKKQRLLEPAEQVAPLFLRDLQNPVEREYGESQKDSAPQATVSSRLQWTKTSCKEDTR
eukprot:6465359-Amphidinium_carterae.1